MIKNAFLTLSIDINELKLSRSTSLSTLSIIPIWIILRLLTTITAVLLSSQVPITEFEQIIPVWPPNHSIGTWLNRVLLAPWVRWDVEWFLRIVIQGYHVSDGTTNFHPLYAWLAKPLFWIGIHPILSLLMITCISLIFFLFYFDRLAQIDLNAEDARTATLLLLISPLAFILFIPYSEALFLLFSVLCFYWARKDKWWYSGIAGMLASLTRQQGILLLFPMAWELWEVSGRSIQQTVKMWKQVLGLGLIPLGLVVWTVYRIVFLSDTTPSIQNIHDFIYSTLISPGASHVVPIQTFLLPWDALGRAFYEIWKTPNDMDMMINLILGGAFILITALIWNRMRISYRIYTILIILVSYSYYTGPVHPYMGLLRHLFLAFPVFIALGSIINRPWKRLIAVFIGMTIGYLFLFSLFMLQSWVL